MRKLRERPRIFVDLYCTPGQPCFLNVGLSALGAGYGKGNIAHARQHGCTLKQVPEVAKAIEDRLREVEKNLRERSLLWAEETERQAMVDVGDLFDEDGQLLPVKKMPEHARRAIASIETEELFEGRGEEREKVGLVRRVKLHDKRASQELLQRLAGKLKDKVEHSGSVGINVVDPYAEPPKKEA